MVELFPLSLVHNFNYLWLLNKMMDVHHGHVSSSHTHT